MKVYLDDEREPPEGWHHVRWPDEAIECLRSGGVTHLSLDHDLGDDERGTGYDVILWMEEAAARHGFQPPAVIAVHSANASARQKMEAGVAAIRRIADREADSMEPVGQPAGDDDSERSVSKSTVTMFRPTGPVELELVEMSGFRRWPPRLRGQPIFYPVTNEEYAREITVKWNAPESGTGYVTRFEVERQFVDRYEIHRVGGPDHEEWWIPAEDLDELNANIVGKIEVVSRHDHTDGN